MLGILANGSSFLVLVKNYKEIPASRLLIGLTLADTGVLIGLSLMGIIPILPDFDGQWKAQTAVIRCYRYFYFCSIYMTVLLSVDRYLVTSRPLKLRRIKYSRLQWGMQAAVFFVAILLVLPEFLGFAISSPTCRAHEVLTVVHSPDSVQLQRSNLNFINFLCSNTTKCMAEIVNDTAKEIKVFRFHEGFCSSLLTPVPNEVDTLEPLKHLICNGDSTDFYLNTAFQSQDETDVTWYHQNFPGAKEHKTCYRYYAAYNETHGNIRIQPFLPPALWSTRDFSLGYIFGVIFPLRYIIPSTVLIYTNIRLVQLVRSSRKQHSAALASRGKPSGKESHKTGILTTVIVVASTFLLLNTLALTLDVWEVVVRNVDFLHLPTNFYDFPYITSVTSAVNSMVNIGIYCYFLPQFRKRWLAMWTCGSIAHSL